MKEANFHRHDFWDAAIHKQTVKLRRSGAIHRHPTPQGPQLQAQPCAGQGPAGSRAAVAHEGAPLPADPLGLFLSSGPELQSTLLPTGTKEASKPPFPPTPFSALL